MAKILIIEDHALSRQMLDTLLGYMGHTVLKAANGEQALNYAKKVVPDLIISDILMPGMDGLELVRRLRQEATLRSTPVIFYTATYRWPEVIQLHELDESYRVLPKPSEPSLLLEAINEVLSCGETQTPLLPASAEKDPPPPADKLCSQATGLRLAVLMDLSVNLVSQRDPDALLRNFCRGTREFLNCRSVLLVMEEDETRHYWTDPELQNSEAVKEIFPPVDVCRQVMEEGILFRWPATSTALPGQPEPMLGAESSLLVVPVASPGEIYGWLALRDRVNAPFFTEEEGEMIMALSKQVALVYENLLLVRKLRKNEERFRLVLSTTGVCSWTWNLASGRVTYLVEKKRGESASLDQDQCLAAIHPEDRPRVTELFAQAIASGRNFETEYRMFWGGKEYWFLTKGLAMREGEHTTELIGINVDITERKRIEEENIASERELLKITLNSLNEGVITTDRSGRVVLINPTARELIGCTEERTSKQLLSNLLTVYNGKTGEKYSSFTPGSAYTDPVLVTGDQRKIPITLEHSPVKLPNGKEIGMVTVFQDISEKRRAERELLKAAKLESLGVLAAGIAHDFNNVLAAIISNLQLASIQYEKQINILPTLAETVEISHQASNLTKQLLTFAKGGAPVRKNAVLSGLIRETTDFVLRGSNIKAEYQMPADLWPVSIDVGQISQVFHNLVLNAQQAMHQGGVIRISGENVEVKTKERLKPGKYVKVTVADQGTGIEQAIMDKIFDPFFTTKANGNGLGLATAISIIHQHDGVIEVESEKNVGSTFYLYLPANTMKLAEVVREKEPVVLEGGLRILLMDDEELISRPVAELLSNFGHEIVTTRNGAETIAAYQEAEKNNNPFDVVILDLTIPGGIGGLEVLTELRRFNPQIRAVVSSGYASDPIIANYQKHGFSGVVSKPYHIKELLAVLAQVAAK
ncbi:MAG TPA: response regulator [Firmicutes bacterium]|nr:response regulator [Bacillota bacterium]